MNANKLAKILSAKGVVHAAAVKDPEGFDGGATLARIAEAAKLIVAVDAGEVFELKLLRDRLDRDRRASRKGDKGWSGRTNDADREYELIAGIVARAEK